MEKIIAAFYIALLLGWQAIPAQASSVVNFEKDAQIVGEDVGRVTVTAVLSKADEVNTIVVPFSVSGTATGGGVDHDLKDGVFTFNPGETRASVSFWVIDDTLPENDEIIVIVMGTPINAVLGKVITHTVKIIDNDEAALPTVSWTAAIQNILENAGVAEVTVALSRISPTIVIVPYTVGGTATGGGEDHDLTDGEIIIPAGEVVGKLMFNIIDDNIHEDNETVIIMMGEPKNAIQGAITIHTVTIIDNDPKPTVSWAKESEVVMEDRGNIAITMVLSAISSKTVTVPFEISGTAIGDGVDYSLSANTVVFVPGVATAMIECHIIDNDIYEKDKTVILTIYSPVNANIGSIGTYTLFIIDNDKDLVPPVITLAGKNPTTIALGTQYSDAGATAVDDIDGDLTDKIVTSSNVNPNIEGVYRVTYDVHDSAGNAAVQVVRLVQVTPVPEIYEVPMGTPSGTVVDHQGVPLPNVIVSSKNAFYITKTDDNGAFFYTPLFLTGKFYYLTFSKDGYISNSRMYSGLELLEKVVLAAENAANHNLITGICRSYQGVPLVGAGVRLESNQYPAMAFSDNDGWYRLAVDQRARPYLITAFKYGYEKKTFTVSAGTILNDIVLTEETIIIVNAPDTTDLHNAARTENQVELRITANPPFTGRLYEIAVEGEGIGAPVFSAGGAYIITHSPYKSFSLRITADTTEDHNVYTGYAAWRSYTFTALPEHSSIIKTNDKLLVALGYPLKMNSRDNNSRTRLTIPADGLQGAYVPETIVLSTTEYTNHNCGFIAGKIVEVTVGDEFGRLFNRESSIDAPLKTIFLTMEYGPPITQQRLEDGTDIIRRADSAQALLNRGGSIISADQIVVLTKDYVTFKSPRTGAFGLEPVDPSTLIPQGLGSPEDDSFCFIKAASRCRR